MDRVQRTDPRRRGWIGGWPLVLLGWLAGPAFLPPAAVGADAVGAAREGLQRLPWYDAEQDQLRRIQVQPPKDLQNRHSKWYAKPWDWDWPDWSRTLIKVLGWSLLGVLLVVLVYLLARAFVQAENQSGTAGRMRDAAVTPGEVERMESLPFQLARPRTNLLDEARRHYEAGRYGEAIIYFYSYQLVKLDQHQAIRLAKGKTNRQYLRELRGRRPELRRMLERSMVAFEDVFFGSYVLDRERFETCWQQLDTFHHALEQGAAP